MVIDPFLHQWDGAAWLSARRRGILGDQQGLGKTLTAAMAADRVSRDTPPVVICPAIARSHWQRTFESIGRDAFIHSYDRVTAGGFALLREVLNCYRPNTLIVDEFHYCKHAGSQRAQMVFGRNGWARRFEHVYPLSGTPIPRHPGEFATTFLPMFPEVALEHGLRTVRDVFDRFTVGRMQPARMGKWALKIVGQQNMLEFREILAKVMLQRTLDDTGLDVPKVFWQAWAIDALQSEPEVPAELRARLAQGESIEELLTDTHVARYRRGVGELKAPIVARVLSDELAENPEQKVVVMAHHLSVLDLLQHGLRQHGVVRIDGGVVGDEKREALRRRFQDDPEVRVFLGQNIACHASLTLTAADRIILVEPDWTAYINDQIAHRVARIGSRFKRCIAQMVCLAGTIDEAVIGQNLRETRMATERSQARTGEET